MKALVIMLSSPKVACTFMMVLAEPCCCSTPVLLQLLSGKSSKPTMMACVLYLA